MTTTTANATTKPLFESGIIKTALREAIAKLHPRRMLRNPVMFVVEVGSAFTTVLFIAALLGVADAPPAFIAHITFWLWATVLSANFAEAMAEGRGKAQADALRASRHDVMASRVLEPRLDAPAEVVTSAVLRKGDLVVIRAGEFIPVDGEIVSGIATVDESAVTGESAPVVRESGGDRSAVTGGTRVLSDWLIVRVGANPGEGFLDRMIAMVEGAARKKTPNEIALDVLLAGLTLVFLLAVVTLWPMSRYAVQATGHGETVSLTVLVALLVCLIPTTIGGLLSAIGIAGMDRLVQANVIATSGRAVEAAGDVSVLLLDKTGTITLGNRQASRFVAAEGATAAELARGAMLASLADDTPEGKSIVVLARNQGHDEQAVGEPVAFNASTRMSGVDLGERRLRKGAVDAVGRWLSTYERTMPPDVKAAADGAAREGSTPLVVVDGPRVLGVVVLKDIVKSGIKERFGDLRRLGIRTVMITGDNPLTAAAIAAEAGVDDYLAEATPEQKLAKIRAYQAEGHLVAMTGDGTNDAPALAQADVAVAMNSGTQAAKEAANMVDLDSSPTKLLDVVQIGKQLLITRGALTTFSIANDISKYFAIIPAAFASTYPALSALNIMQLSSPTSAVLSAVIFNAVVIVGLIPLALRGVKMRAATGAELLRRNLMVFGVGGLVLPFPCIKLIDVVLTALGVA